MKVDIEKIESKSGFGIGIDDDVKIRVERNKKAEPVSPGSSNMVRSALSRRFNSHCHCCRPYHCQSKLLSPPQRD